jgi:two-component system response regulator GlrR
MSHCILIVESADRASSSSETDRWVGAEWGGCERVAWERFDAETVRKAGFRLLIVDAMGAAEPAGRLFRRLRERPCGVPVFAIVDAGDARLLEVAAEVADEFLLGPVRPEELQRRISRLLGPRQTEVDEVAARLTAELGKRRMLGADPAFQRAMAQMARFAANDAPVLLTGETGTGKELGARVIHLLSRRHAGPFIPVDCGALPDHLFENEVFGHVKGAFTDARADQKGLVALANGGTLFLDEIDSLSLPAQSKLLRLLQERTYRALGAEVFQRADVRILAATNRRLEELVELKQFRADLFFRINVLRVHLPALRERASDIRLLSKSFVEEICADAGIPRKGLSEAALLKLERHDWPGNVRELYNILQRAVLCSTGQQIASPGVELEGCGEASGEVESAAELQDFRQAKLQAIQLFESGYVRRMMEKHAGNVTQAAREAIKDRRAFGRLVKKYGENRAE